ncbi:MAG: isochorismatase family cysteine hydrolase [Dehalococcoidia bacterium]|nr:isochorismatase family cysteine hydrolase [Dehalococcoidia bacterium]
MLSLADKVDPKHCLLLVVDIQNDFCHPEGSMGRAGQDLSMVDEMMPHLLEVLQEARQVRAPVIFTQAVHSSWSDSQASNTPWRTRLDVLKEEVPRPCLEGSWGADLYEVTLNEGERALTKPRYSAFYGTELDVMLRAMGIKTLLMTGVATNVCVETTARDGFMRDYQIVFLSDCCATYDRAQHEATLTNIDKYFGMVTTSKEVLNIWKGIATPRLG